MQYQFYLFSIKTKSHAVRIKTMYNKIYWLPQCFGLSNGSEYCLFFYESLSCVAVCVKKISHPNSKVNDAKSLSWRCERNHLNLPIVRLPFHPFNIFPLPTTRALTVSSSKSIFFSLCSQWFYQARPKHRFPRCVRNMSKKHGISMEKVKTLIP